VFDTRFLPNPFTIDELRRTGLDPVVVAFLEGDEYQTSCADHRSPTSCCSSHRCTGGRHRSVAMAEAVGTGLREHGLAAKVSHRDMEKE
jgi:UPF0042 nucleotide-binding protein